MEALHAIAAIVFFPIVAASEPLKETPCVGALEQVATLQAMSPVYKGDGPDRQFIEDADRPTEIAHFKKIIRKSCSTNPVKRIRQASEARRLHLALSQECRLEWAKQAAFYAPNSGISKERIADQNKLVAEKCPALRLDNRWIVFE